MKQVTRLASEPGDLPPPLAKAASKILCIAVSSTHAVCTASDAGQFMERLFVFFDISHYNFQIKLGARSRSVGDGFNEGCAQIRDVCVICQRGK